MSFGPSEGQPIVWAVLLVFGLAGAIAYSLGSPTKEALFWAGGIAFPVLSWAIGLHQYIFSTPISHLLTHIKGFLIRSISSLFYLVLFLGILFFNDSSIINKATYITILSSLSLLWAFLLYRRIRLIERKKGVSTL